MNDEEQDKELADIVHKATGEVFRNNPTDKISWRSKMLLVIGAFLIIINSVLNIVNYERISSKSVCTAQQNMDLRNIAADDRTAVDDLVHGFEVYFKTPNSSLSALTSLFNAYDHDRAVNEAKRNATQNHQC